MVDLKSMLQYTKEINVLYVEDDETLSLSTSKVFNNYFKRVDIAIDGKEGLECYDEYFKKNNAYYNLIITDINMPNMNGIDMCEKILSKNPMQSIIITSAHNEVKSLQSAIDLGISGFITKPMVQEKLNNVIFKVSRAIYDHMFVESHISKIEELNLKLEEQNAELKLKHEELNKSSRILDTVIHKNQITNSEKETASNVEEVDDVKTEQKLEQIRLLIHDDLYEIREIVSEIDVAIIEIINNVTEIKGNSLEELITLFSRYSSLLSFYTIFDELSTSMSDFSITIRDNPLPENEEKIKNVFMLLESFMYVLNKWNEDLASEEEDRINSLDASIISDMHTITNMWTQKEEVNEGLDDIFDF